MLEVPSNSQDPILQDHFNSELARAIEKIAKDVLDYKTSIRDYYHRQAIINPTGTITWNELYNGIKDF